jgi:hypothetical protein
MTPYNSLLILRMIILLKTITYHHILVYIFSDILEYYIEVLHVIYQQKLEKILYKLKLTVTLLFLREKCITLLKKGKIWSGHSLRAFSGNFWVCIHDSRACISITDHNRPLKVIYCLDYIMHQVKPYHSFILYYNILFADQLCNIL